MNISERQLTSFKSLYKEHFGEELSQTEAREKAIKLLRMIQLIYHPITKVEHQLALKLSSAPFRRQ